MPVDAELRSLNIDIPAQPEALVKLSLLLAEDEVNLQALSGLIESDMALASAVLKAVNSSLYGLAGRVQSVQQAITYLGTREVAAGHLRDGPEGGLSLPRPSSIPCGERAAVRGLLMGRIGQQLDLDPWAAHSAGLFEECGKAVLFRHTPSATARCCSVQERRGAAVSRAPGVRRQPRCAGRRAVRKLGPSRPLPCTACATT
jgi:HD-like signal output (HDOD) protein